MTLEIPDHPAPFTQAAINRARYYLEDLMWILDPFAGIGGVHDLGKDFVTIGVEIEPRWAAAHVWTQEGDATALDFPDASFDGVFTSPTYGNRMADHHNARDSSKRITYKHVLGEDLQPNNSGKMQWGQAYRDLHQKAWEEVTRVTKPAARFVLVIKNHIRDGTEQLVKEWHLGVLKDLGWVVIADEALNSRGMRMGANRELRTTEYLVVLDKA